MCHPFSIGTEDGQPSVIVGLAFLAIHNNELFFAGLGQIRHPLTVGR
jgi:hypothetical protein